MIKTTILVLAAMGASIISGCSSSPKYPEYGTPGLPSPGDTKTVKFNARPPSDIAPGFEITLACPEDPNLAGKYRISFENELKLPYKVKVSTEGATLAELRERISNAYRSYFKKLPVINLSVSEKKYWVEVRGLVEKPGRYLVNRDTSLDEILAQSGGVQKNATARYVRFDQGGPPVVIRMTDYYSGRSNMVPKWVGGDIIFFQSDRDDSSVAGGSDAVVQILGEVRTPGEYRYRAGSDFYYYLTKAGGPTAQTDFMKIEVIRGPDGLKSSKTYSLDHAEEVPTPEVGDLVIVHADHPTPLERVMPVVAGITGVITSVMLVVIAVFHL